VTAPLLELGNVSKTFGPTSTVASLFWRRRVAAVVDVSFTLPSDRAEIFTIVGQSGSGKTTLARMILGLEVPT
jgi:ABC-type oligopeptide transport system ATPase subunit